MSPNEIMNWKPADEKPAAKQAEKAEKPETPKPEAPKAETAKSRKPRKPSAPKAKKPLANTGWFIECYPLMKDGNGNTVVDLAGGVFFGPIDGAKNEKDVMPHLRALADTDPGSLAGHSVRIVKVASVMAPKVRQVVDFD